MYTHVGHKCSHPLTLRVRDGCRLSEDDLETINTFFANDRVWSLTESDRTHVWVLYNSRISHNPPALKSVGYGSLPYMVDLQEILDLAVVVGREILGTDVEVRLSEKDNGEFWVAAYCPKENFTLASERS